MHCGVEVICHSVGVEVIHHSTFQSGYRFLKRIHINKSTYFWKALQERKVEDKIINILQEWCQNAETYIKITKKDGRYTYKEKLKLESKIKILQSVITLVMIPDAQI